MIALAVLLPISFALSDACEVIDEAVNNEAKFMDYAQPLGEETQVLLSLCLFGDGSLVE